jgi:hypothetical protein
MKKIVDYVDYIAKVFAAIAGGIRAASDSWPTDNPFKSNEPKNK